MVKMVLGASDTQANTTKATTQSRMASYNQAMSALANFDEASDLQGAAYDSGKTYGISTITPLIKGALMYSEMLGESVPKLPVKYRAEVGGEDLDSAVLEEEINKLENSLSSLRGIFRSLSKDDHTSPATIQSMSSRMDSLTSRKNELMEKLRKLNLFAGSSNDVFGGKDGIEAQQKLLGNIEAGLGMIHTEFENFSGTFPKHSKDSLDWVKNIEGEWNNKTKIDEAYQKVLKKLEDGKKLNEKDIQAIQNYQKRYPARDLPENVQKELNSPIHKKLSIPQKGLTAKKEEVDWGGLWDSLWGYEMRVGQDSTFKIKKHDLYSTYVKTSNHVVSEDKGIFIVKSENQNISGFAIDLKFVRCDINFSNGHFISTSKFSLPNGNNLSTRFDIGFDPDRMYVPETNLSVGAGDSKTTTEVGLNLSADFVNGVGGIYTRRTETTQIGENLKNIAVEEMGGKAGDGPTIVIGSLLLLAALRPETQEFVLRVNELIQKTVTR